MVVTDFCHPLQVGVGLQVTREVRLLRVKMGMTPFLAVLLSLVACAAAARDVFNPITNDAGGTHQFPNGPLILNELSKLFQNEAPSLNGLPTDFCPSCLDISRKAKKILNDPSLLVEVDYFTHSFCQILPSDLEAKCVKMVEISKREAVMFLQDAFLEENLCYNTGFCPGESQKSSLASYGKTELLSAMEPFTKMLSRLPEGSIKETASRFLNNENTFTETERRLELRSNATCIACRSVIDKARIELEDPDKQMKIISSLLKACEIEVFVYKCKKLVFAYGPLVLSNLQKIVKMDLCHMMHICTEPRNQTSHVNIMSF